MAYVWTLNNPSPALSHESRGSNPFPPNPLALDFLSQYPPSSSCVSSSVVSDWGVGDLLSLVTILGRAIACEEKRYKIIRMTYTR